MSKKRYLWYFIAILINLTVAIPLSIAATLDDQIVPIDYPFAHLYEPNGHIKLSANPNLPSDFPIVMENLNLLKRAYDINVNGEKIPVNAKEFWDGDIKHGKIRAHFIALLVTAGYATKYTTDIEEDPVRESLSRMSYENLLAKTLLTKKYKYTPDFVTRVLLNIKNSPLFGSIIDRFPSQKLRDKLDKESVLSRLPFGTSVYHDSLTPLAQALNTSLQSYINRLIPASDDGVPTYDRYFAPEQVQAGQKVLNLCMRTAALCETIAPFDSEDPKRFIRNYYQSLCSIATDVLEIPQSEIDSWFVIPGMEGSSSSAHAAVDTATAAVSAAAADG